MRHWNEYRIQTKNCLFISLKGKEIVLVFVSFAIRELFLATNSFACILCNVAHILDGCIMHFICPHLSFFTFVFFEFILISWTKKISTHSHMYRSKWKLIFDVCVCAVLFWSKRFFLIEISKHKEGSIPLYPKPNGFCLSNVNETELVDGE